MRHFVKKINTFLFVLFLSIIALVSCTDDVNKPKEFSITYKSNIVNVKDITVKYTIGDANIWPFLSFEGVTGKYVKGYAETKTNADNGTVDYRTGDSIEFNSDKTVYAVWENGEVYALTIDPQGATDYDVDILYYVNSPEDSKGWYRDITKEKLTSDNSFARPEYVKTLKFVSNMDGVSNPSDVKREWNVLYSEEPDADDYSYYFKKNTDETKKDDVFDIEKTIDKNVTAAVNWDGLHDEVSHESDLPLVSKDGKWFTGWKKSNGALYVKFDSDQSETLTLTGSWMDEVKKEIGTEVASDENMIMNIARLEFAINDLQSTGDNAQTSTTDDGAVVVLDLYSLEHQYKSFKISDVSHLFYTYFEVGESVGKYWTFDGKIDDSAIKVEAKISVDMDQNKERYDFLIVNGVSYASRLDEFEADLDAAVKKVATDEGVNG